jgi:hypothetical protein
MGKLAGYIQDFVSHDVRSGGVQDISRLSLSVTNTVHKGVAQAVGHGSVRSTAHYFHGDLISLIQQRAALPPSHSTLAIEAQRSAKPYPGLRGFAFSRRLDRYIHDHAEEFSLTSHEMTLSWRQHLCLRMRLLSSSVHSYETMLCPCEERSLCRTGSSTGQR